MSVKVNALDHIVINVADVARSAEWYRKILGMEVRVFDPGPGKTPRTSLVFGNQKINVRPRGADKVEWFTADHETAGSDDSTHCPPNRRVEMLLRSARSPHDPTVRPRRNGVCLLRSRRRPRPTNRWVRWRSPGVGLALSAASPRARSPGRR